MRASISILSAVGRHPLQMRAWPVARWLVGGKGCVLPRACARIVCCGSLSCPPVLCILWPFLHPVTDNALFVVNFSLFCCCRPGAASIAGKLERETSHSVHVTRGWPIEHYSVRGSSKAGALAPSLVRRLHVYYDLYKYSLRCITMHPPQPPTRDRMKGLRHLLTATTISDTTSHQCPAPP